MANDLVSVQAMNLPIGKLFYFVPKIQSYQVGGTNAAGGGIHYGAIGAQNGPTVAEAQAGYGANDKNLYDRFYEGNEATLDPAGLFDYSKGSFSSITKNATTVAWSNGVMVPTAYTLTGGQVAATGADGGPVYRKALIVMSGFSSAGAGKLIGPDGQEMDNEAFLTDLQINAIQSGGSFSGLGTGDLLFRVVTQKYGKGIVQYGTQQQTTFYSGTYPGNGGSYDNICSQTGLIYLEVDCQVPCPIGSNSLDGYSGFTTPVAPSTAAATGQFTATYRVYQELEFEDKIGEVSFDLESVTVSVTERKLRAQWSPELAQDVAAFHNIDFFV